MLPSDASVEELRSGDHRSLDQLLSDLLVALDKGDARMALRKLDLFWARLGMHIRAENLHLFPSILRNATHGGPSFAATNKAIDQLRRDHDFFMKALGGAIKTLRAGQSASQMREVAESVRSVFDRLRSHNELEELVVYLLPEKTMTRDSQKVLGEQVRYELTNLPPRFADKSADGG